MATKRDNGSAERERRPWDKSTVEDIISADQRPSLSLYAHLSADFAHKGGLDDVAGAACDDDGPGVVMHVRALLHVHCPSERVTLVQELNCNTHTHTHVMLDKGLVITFVL